MKWYVKEHRPHQIISGEIEGMIMAIALLQARLELLRDEYEESFESQYEEDASSVREDDR